MKKVIFWLFLIGITASITSVLTPPVLSQGCIDEWESCNPGDTCCTPGFSCTGGYCQPAPTPTPTCGMHGQPCCSGNVCYQSGDTCQGGFCYSGFPTEPPPEPGEPTPTTPTTACGGAYQPCCQTGDPCRPGFVCSWGECRPVLPTPGPTAVSPEPIPTLAPIPTTAPPTTSCGDLGGTCRVSCRADEYDQGVRPPCSQDPYAPEHCCVSLAAGGGCIPTAIGCINVESPEAFVGSILSLAVGIAGGIALLLIIYGAFQVLISAGNPDKIQAGKELITSAIAGLLLIIFALFILRLIGYEIFKLPGFE